MASHAWATVPLMRISRRKWLALTAAAGFAAPAFARGRVDRLAIDPQIRAALTRERRRPGPYPHRRRLWSLGSRDGAVASSLDEVAVTRPSAAAVPISPDGQLTFAVDVRRSCWVRGTLDLEPDADRRPGLPRDGALRRRRRGRADGERQALGRRRNHRSCTSRCGRGARDPSDPRPVAAGGRPSLPHCRRSACSVGRSLRSSAARTGWPCRRAAVPIRVHQRHPRPARGPRRLDEPQDGRCRGPGAPCDVARPGGGGYPVRRARRRHDRARDPRRVHVDA